MRAARAGLGRVRAKFGGNWSRGKTTPKRAPKDYYKGKGVRRTGRNTTKGGFVVEPERVAQFVVPDLDDCPLKPYVDPTTPKVHVSPPTALDKSELLRHFLRANGVSDDVVEAEVQRTAEETV